MSGRRQRRPTHRHRRRRCASAASSRLASAGRRWWSARLLVAGHAGRQLNEALHARWDRSATSFRRSTAAGRSRRRFTCWCRRCAACGCAWRARGGARRRRCHRRRGSQRRRAQPGLVHASAIAAALALLLLIVAVPDRQRSCGQPHLLPAAADRKLLLADPEGLLDQHLHLPDRRSAGAGLGAGGRARAAGAGSRGAADPDDRDVLCRRVPRPAGDHQHLPDRLRHSADRPADR